MVVWDEAHVPHARKCTNTCLYFPAAHLWRPEEGLPSPLAPYQGVTRLQTAAMQAATHCSLSSLATGKALRLQSYSRLKACMATAACRSAIQALEVVLLLITLNAAVAVAQHHQAQ